MRAIVLHAGGTGDLVLLESYFAALRAQHDDVHLALVCRADVAPVASLYANPPSEVQAFTFNPYSWTTAGTLDLDELRALTAWCSAYRSDVFVGAELRGTALTAVLAAACGSPRIVVSDAVALADPVGARVAETLQYEPPATVEIVPPAAGEHELDRYARLAGAPARRAPRLQAWADPGVPILAVFPAGAPAIKLLPDEVVVEAATHSALALGVPIALIGAEHERERLQTLAARFGEPPEIITGAPDQLSAVARRLAGARAFLGMTRKPFDRGL